MTEPTEAEVQALAESGELFRRRPLRVAVLAALAEIVDLARCAKQWEAWKNAKRTTVENAGGGIVTNPLHLLESAEHS